MLTKGQLKGLWVSVPTEWDEDMEFDEETFRREISMLIDSGVHGLYTTGTTGEFHALDWDEWKNVQNAFLDEAAGRVPVQVGANWFNTRGTIKRVRHARDIGADAVQVCFPGWIETTDEHYDQFLIDVFDAVPDIAIIHYNTSRAKKVFCGKDYARLIGRIPTLLGSKAGVPFGDYAELVVYSPEMHHFVGEMLFPLAHQLGAMGMYTSWYMMNPEFIHEYYNMCVEGRYAEAIAISMRLVKWCDEAVIPLIRKGYRDPALDKPFVVMGGWLPGNRRTRKPYTSINDEEFAQLRRVTERIVPEFVSYKP